jgi:hypothetical protein
VDTSSADGDRPAGEKFMPLMMSEAHVAASLDSSDGEPDLLALVDLKWLMCAYGDWIDVPRLRHDAVYAMHCLDEALTLPSELVRSTAERVLKPLIQHAAR